VYFCLPLAWPDSFAFIFYSVLSVRPSLAPCLLVFYIASSPYSSLYAPRSQPWIYPIYPRISCPIQPWKATFKSRILVMLFLRSFLFWPDSHFLYGTSAKYSYLAVVFFPKCKQPHICIAHVLIRPSKNFGWRSSSSGLGLENLNDLKAPFF